jgi:NAD(P)-dependent dehydrogenase (short-subunit alcohol dehydrogenase family)
MCFAAVKGKVCVVTGASAGIGLVTARELARMGATTIVVARDRSRGEAALRAIRRAIEGGDVSLMLCDLSSQASIRRFADELARRHDRLHVLVNNAGGVQAERRLTEDGVEVTFATNHLGPFLLTRLLLDRLRAGAPARVVNVSSEAHRRGRLEFDDLQLERAWSPLRAYNASKLACIAFTIELARRLAGSGVTANCLHPGVVATELGRGSSPVFRALFGLARPFLMNVDEGARTQIHLASSPAVAEVTGRYFIRGEAARPSKAAEDPAAARRLWELSEALTGLRAHDGAIAT